MARKQTPNRGDSTPVTGGIALPSRLISTPTADDGVPDDDLGRQAYWLLKLHPDKVSLRFRQSDLSAMDDNTKRQLIADIQYALGVSPFEGNTL
jgi:hypothetical protein